MDNALNEKLDLSALHLGIISVGALLGAVVTLVACILAVRIITVLLRRVLGNHFIGDEDENIAYLWQNRYHEQQNCVEMNLAIFVRQEGETYLRIGEQQRQYAHTAETLGTLLHECGFTDVAFFGDKHMEAPGEKECRWFVAARKPLGGAEV